MSAQDAVVEIPVNRVKFFGTTGRMLLPGTATVAALVREIPERRVTTTDLLRRELARRFGVEAVCPITTRKALLAVARDTAADAPYWRVLNVGGALNTGYPGGIDGHAARLRAEGFEIDATGRKHTVVGLNERLAPVGLPV